MQKVTDLRTLPQDAVLVSVGSGEYFSYAPVGLKNVFVQGAFDDVEVSGAGKWLIMKDIHKVHRLICIELLKRDNLSSDAFAFVRKHLLLTVEEASMALGIDGAAVHSWEAGRGFLPSLLIDSIRSLFSRLSTSEGAAAECPSIDAEMQQSA